MEVNPPTKLTLGPSKAPLPVVLQYMYFRLEIVFHSRGCVLPIPQYARALPTLRNPALLLVLFTLLGSAALTRDKYQQPSPRRVAKVDPGPNRKDPDDNWAEKTLNTLSLEEKVGQLFMIRLRVEFLRDRSPSYLQLRDSIRNYHIGSLAMSVPGEGRSLFGDHRYESVNLLNQLQAEAKLPLLIAGDFERGVLPARLRGG